MHQQTREREERLLDAVPDPALTLETGSSPSSPGAGNRRLFESYGAARVIEGGQTMNPSTADILAAIEATPATEVLVLPNNGNVILSAEQAAAAGDEARARDPVALGAGGPRGDRPLPPLAAAAENEARDARGAREVATGEVTVASRDVELDGVAVRKGA